MEITQSNIIEALYCKINRNSSSFKLSRQKFKILFGFDPTYYCYEWYATIHKRINEMYNGCVETQYFAALQCILGLKALIYSSPKSNSYENEYSLLYAFLNIININRSQIRNKQPLRDKLFWTFLFCTPSPEYIVCGTRISPTGLLYYHKVNIDKAVYEITHLSDINKHIDEPEIGQINKILSVAYSYLTGKELFMPQYRYMDIYGYYFFNPLDYINLYQYDKRTFYELMDKSVVGKFTFMKRAFVYNYNLYIVDNIDKIIELKENLRNFEAVKKVLFFSGVTIRNPILLDIKSGNITY
ncbi:hypothetical protein [Bacteroides acidifaciens]|uniref:hypothetical protein n=1 Tax=Bacteroides acidifaciens TaxID=85831 RepID=UPI00255806B9|nr:hypothetical protein [Bacteroides acidifaciens]